MQVTSDGARLLRPRGAAKYLGVGLTSFWGLVKRGELPEPVQLTPHMRGWDVADLDDFINRKKAEAIEPMTVEPIEDEEVAYG